MNLSRERLYDTLGQIASNGVVSVRGLLNLPTLRAGLMQDLRSWAADEVGRDDAVMAICTEVCRDAEVLADRFVAWFFAAHPDGKHRRLDGLITMVRVGGATLALEFLEKAMDNFTSQFRCKEVRRPADVGDDGDIAESILGALGMEAGEFIADVAFLAGPLGVSNAAVCELLLSGSQVRLVEGMLESLSRCLDRDVSQTLAPLLRQAEAFELPARFRENRDALLAFICRQDRAVTRERLLKRSHPGDR